MDTMAGLTIQMRLEEARDALHGLQIGRAVVEVVDQNGERVRYAQANRSALQAYIDSLESQLGIGRNNGPMRFWGGR